LTKAIEVRAKGMSGEVLFPEPRREEMDLKGGMDIDALEHIDEVDIGINPLKPAGGDQTLHDTDIGCAHFRPAEPPLPPAQGNGPNLPL